MTLYSYTEGGANDSIFAYLDMEYGGAFYRAYSVGVHNRNNTSWTFFASRKLNLISIAFWNVKSNVVGGKNASGQKLRTVVLSAYVMDTNGVVTTLYPQNTKVVGTDTTPYNANVYANLAMDLIPNPVASKVLIPQLLGVNQNSLSLTAYNQSTSALSFSSVVSPNPSNVKLSLPSGLGGRIEAFTTDSVETAFTNYMKSVASGDGVRSYGIGINGGVDSYIFSIFKNDMLDIFSGGEMECMLLELNHISVSQKTPTTASDIAFYGNKKRGYVTAKERVFRLEQNNLKKLSKIKYGSFITYQNSASYLAQIKTAAGTGSSCGPGGVC